MNISWRMWVLSMVPVALGCASAPLESGSLEATGGMASSDGAARSDDGIRSDGGMTDTKATPCSAAVSGIQVHAIDLQGYPPYAVDDCRLVYVASPESAHAGALVLRDLSDGTESILASAESAPRRPAIEQDVIAWEQLESGIPVVRIAVDERPLTITGPFHHAGEPRVAGDAVVFTGWLTENEDGDADVFLYSLETQSVELVLGGPAQQRFADISSSHVAISDFSEDPGGFYDTGGYALADIVVFNRGSGELTRRQFEGKQAYPMLGADGQLGYLEWIGVRPMPKLQGYDVRIVALDNLDARGWLVAEVETDPPSIRPSALGDYVEWVTHVDGLSSLWRARADVPSTPLRVEGLDGLELYAPAATRDFTVLASEPFGTRALLQSAPR